VIRTASLVLPLVCWSLAAAAPLDEVHFASWGARELSYLDRRPYYLTRQELLALEVAPPPLSSAPATRAELDELLRLQGVRTATQRREIEEHREYAGLCAAFFDRLHRPVRSLPKTQALLRHVDADLMLAVFHAKRRFERARPHQLEPRLHPSIPVPPHPAYPSGHALQGHVVALVLGLLSPGKRAPLLALGEQIGHEREIAGLHYPSDSAASRALGDALFARLEKNPAFRRDLDAARAEWPRD
jgi:acid phosphatase (class A)